MGECGMGVVKGTLDSIVKLVAGEQEKWMGLLTHKSLTRFSPDGSIAGDLASSWDSPDEELWTFRIRPDVNGTTAKKSRRRMWPSFTYKYLREKFPVYVRHFNLLEDVQAVDGQTVTVHLLSPNSQFAVNVCGIEILPKHIFENVADPGSFFGSKAALGWIEATLEWEVADDRYALIIGQVVCTEVNDLYVQDEPFA
jgi:hypothetical protein